MRIPAGRPCRVITISSSAASRRYFDRSSFTSASATSRGLVRLWRPFCVEPGLRFCLGDDREDLDFRFCNVIEHPDITDVQAVLRLAESSKALDSTLAELCRLVCQMHVKSPLYASADRHRQAFQRDCRCRRESDFKFQSGYILARFVNSPGLDDGLLRVGHDIAYWVANVDADGDDSCSRSWLPGASATAAAWRADAFSSAATVL
jgi:hypothetical protein